ncbi:hypothetical protein AAG906_038947 [Vitis piasezkii]
MGDSSSSDVKGRNHSQDRGRQMLVLSFIHRGFLGPIGRSHALEPHFSHASHQDAATGTSPWSPTHPRTAMLLQIHSRPAPLYPRPRAQGTSAPFASRMRGSFPQIGMPLSQALRKLIETGLLTALTPRPLPQPIPAQFRMDLHYQGLVHLGQPSVTTNPLPTHTTHAVPPPADGIHFLDFDEIDDHVHMLSWDDPDRSLSCHRGIYETQWGISSGRRVLRHPPPAAIARPFGGTSSRRSSEDDEILRRLSTRLVFLFGAFSILQGTHRDAPTRALSGSELIPRPLPRDSFI